MDISEMKWRCVLGFHKFKFEKYSKYGTFVYYKCKFCTVGKVKNTSVWR